MTTHKARHGVESSKLVSLAKTPTPINKRCQRGNAKTIDVDAVP